MPDTESILCSLKPHIALLLMKNRSDSLSVAVDEDGAIPILTQRSRPVGQMRPQNLQGIKISAAEQRNPSFHSEASST